MKRLLVGAVVLLLLVGMVAPAQAQTPVPPVYVTNLLNAMTPEERVGQLFLVTFQGRDVIEGSQAYDLIVNYHVGGVALLAANDNFTAAPDTALDAQRLIAELQGAESASVGQPILNNDGVEIGLRKYAPLWVGIVQEGNGAPTDQILHGLTPLPSQMALGATWDPALAEQAGALAGKELAALGFNLIFGPSLDVVDNPSATLSGDLGTRVFGGDPFWVGEMARAYVRGLHTGSGNRMLAIVKHFPGQGSADRLPDEEVSTIRKSLEQLKQIELAPFFAVTGAAPDAASSADGLLVSHLRIQGLRQNIRAITRPLSFDSQALSEILSVPELKGWWENGGLIVSDDLGSRAVYNFYAPGGGAFNARLIARDAFLAGNDMLYLGAITASDMPDSYSTTTQILGFFAQKYREDPAFAARVDAAVARILARKFKMYGNFNEARFEADRARLEGLGASESLTFQVASEAATLISPDRQDLDTVLPASPVAADYVVFLTDTSMARQCPACPDEPTLATDALQQTVLRLYGTGAGGQVIPSHLISYTFKDIANWMDGTGGEFVEPDLRRAQWVVISLANAASGQPQLVRRFLSERQDILRNKKVILLSFGAPYYFDSTDISKLSAYFALYGKTSPFVEVAARILFQEATLDGRSPVSIPGADYDLISVTTPNPAQLISLFLDLPTAATPPASPSLTAEPTSVPLARIGDTVVIRTGELLDHNGHIVPDGTVVRFFISLGGEGGGLIKQEDAQTMRGVARISYRIEKPGLLEIRAASEPATLSQVLQLDVKEGEPFVVTVIVPVASPTETVTPIPATPTLVEESDFVDNEGHPRFGGWLLTLFVLGGGAWLSYWAGGRVGSRRWSARWGLCALLGGLLAYNYLALGLPGAADALVAGGGGAMVGITIAGEILGALGAWLWMWRKSR
ncbi:MAG: glycoside hydrolase family 3 N-terminal domain-containing protein [Chloroflexota bacterium]